MLSLRVQLAMLTGSTGLCEALHAWEDLSFDLRAVVSKAGHCWLNSLTTTNSCSELSHNCTK